MLVIPTLAVVLCGICSALKFHRLTVHSEAAFNSITRAQKLEVLTMCNELLCNDTPGTDLNVPSGTQLCRSRKALRLLLGIWLFILGCSVTAGAVLEFELHQQLNTFLTEAAFYNQVGGLRRMAPLLTYFWLKEEFVLSDPENSYAALLAENSYYGTPGIQTELATEHLRRINRELLYEHQASEVIDELMLGQTVPNGGLNANLIDYCNTIRMLLAADSSYWQEVIDLEEKSLAISTHYADLLHLYKDLELEISEQIWTKILCTVLAMVVLSLGAVGVASKVFYRYKTEALALLRLSSLVTSPRLEVGNSS